MICICVICGDGDRTGAGRRAAHFLAGADYLKRHGDRLSADNPDGRIIYTLINTEKNRHMLEGLPHRGDHGSFCHIQICRRRQRGRN